MIVKLLKKAHKSLPLRHKRRINRVLRKAGVMKPTRGVRPSTTIA